MTRLPAVKVLQSSAENPFVLPWSDDIDVFLEPLQESQVVRQFRANRSDAHLTAHEQPTIIQLT